MRVAIISDSHGNLTALDAVLQELDRSGPYDEVLMGGDVAYGGPYPRACIERIQERGYRTVRGNTDQNIIDAANTGGDDHGDWVVQQLTRSHVEFLESLPVQVNVTLEGGRMLGLVHATPWSIYEGYLPSSDPQICSRMLDEAGTEAVAFGHIHLQDRSEIESGLVIAVGALGLPFDGDQRAMYTVIESDGDGIEVDFRRITYDVDRAIQEARESGGPNGPTFADRLTTATRPS